MAQLKTGSTVNGEVIATQTYVDTAINTTSFTSNAWISSLYAEVVNTNFLDYITGTDVNGATIGNDKLKRNYIHIEDQDLEMIEQVLTLVPVNFTILINNINRQVYYTTVRGDDAYNFYSIVSPIKTAITWSANKSYNTNQILLGEDNNYYYALDGYTNLYPDWATALASGFLIITTEEQHKVQVKTITTENIKSSYSFVDIDGVATPRIQLGIGTGVGDNGKAIIYKDQDKFAIKYYKSTNGSLIELFISDDGIVCTGNTGAVGIRNIAIGADAPTNPQLNDLWIDTEV